MPAGSSSASLFSNALVGDRDDVGAKLLGLGREEIDRPSRPERADDKAVPGRSEHVEGLGADRTGRTYNGKPPP